MVSLFEPGRIGPIEVPNRVVMASMTTRAADHAGLRHVADARLLRGAGARRRRPDHGGDGVARAMRPAPAPRARHLRRSLPSRSQPTHRCNPRARGEGLHPARPCRRPYPRRRVRRGADRALRHPARGAGGDDRDDRAAGHDAATHRGDDGGLRAGCRACPCRRLRLCRDPRRPRLPDLAVPHAVREPPR